MNNNHFYVYPRDLTMKKLIIWAGLLISIAVFFVTSSPLMADIICTVSVNSAILDLSAGKPKADSIELSWTTPDIKSVKSALFDIRYCETVITTEDWDDAIQVVGEPQPRPGAVQKMKVKDLEGSTTYCFAIKIVGIDNLDSPLSNLAVATTSGKTTNPGANFSKYYENIKVQLWLGWKWWYGAMNEQAGYSFFFENAASGADSGYQP
jgi:hypothetical protein